jgi:sodium-dependent dicarboxylate transporter 2/3/5
MAALIATEKKGLGPLGRGEIAVLVVFLLTALGWITQPLLVRVLPLLTDTTIAMTGALLLFVIPVHARQGRFVMHWADTKGLPWDVLLLFGGGLSLAGHIEKHGVSRYLGELCNALHGVPMLLTLAIVCFGILMLTELTSNTATAATFLPIAAAIAVSLGQNPLLFVIPTALAANCSFMMPVGTPPNAIVFGSGSRDPAPDGPRGLAPEPDHGARHPRPRLVAGPVDLRHGARGGSGLGAVTFRRMA